MIWLACYDIGDDNIRALTSRIFLAFGFERIQRSVFFGHEPELEALLIELEKVKERLDKDDLLVILPLCKSCERAVIWLGGAPPQPQPTFKII